MNAATDIPDRTTMRAWRSVLWLLVAVLGSLSVALLNGEPLYYYDSGGYLDNGLTVLRQFGVISPQTTAGVSAAGGAPFADDTVNASRSVVYAIISTFLAIFTGPKSIPLFHSVALFAAVWLPARLAFRLYQPSLPVPAFVAFPVLAACAGSLPFYVAYLMPDILSGILLLMIATLTVFVRQMTVFEIALAIALGGLAVVSHLSHLAIAGLSLPVVFIVSLIVSGRRWWMPTLAVAAVVGVGMTERLGFSVVAEKVADSEVVYYPFITARIIQDGPGLRFLETRCPDLEISTCALYEAFSKSDDPMRFTASHILFEKSAELGSFRLLTEVAQNAIAKDQIQFFLAVLTSYPVSTIGALLNNTLIQTQKASIEMTIPFTSVFVGISAIPSLPEGLIKEGRLSGDRAWIETVDTVHLWVYSVSLAVIFVLCVWPGMIRTDAKIFAMMVLLGILANAFVCGGISQPSNRYGARVIWLLPYLAALLVMLSGFSNIHKAKPKVRIDG